MADWGSVLGGIGYGIVGAQQDQYQRDEQAYLQQQRKRAIQQQQLEDQLQQRVRGISRTELAEDRSGMAPDEVGPSPATRSVPKSDERYYGELADAYTESGLPQYVTAGLGLKSTALQQQAAKQQLESGARQADREKQLDAIRTRYAAIHNAVRNGEWNHPEIAGLLTQFNQQQGAFNDGVSAYGASTAQGPVLSFMDKDGRHLSTVPMTPQAMAPLVEQAYMAELALHDPKYAFENASLGIKRGALGVQQKEAELKERKLPFETSLLTAQTSAQNSIPALNAAHGRAFDAQATAASSRSTADKLPDGAKIELNKLGDIVKMAEHDANQDPNNPKLTGAAVRANINYWTALQRHKVIDPSFDIFAASGAPPVEDGAASLFKGKKPPTQKDIDTAVQQASALYTPAYGAKLRAAITARMPTTQTPGDPAAPPTPTTPSAAADASPARGISRNTPSAYAKQRQEETAARKAEADKRAAARSAEQEAAAQRLRNAGW